MPTHMHPIKPDASTDALRNLAFDALLGLAEKHGGGTSTFGDQTPLAHEAWGASLIGHAFPSLWLELPLLGEPGFDLHVYYDRGQVGPKDRFDEGCGFGCQRLFDWFFAEETGGVGVGFAHDLRGGDIVTGAYVNFNHRPLDNLSGFFSSLGADWATEGLGGLIARVPEGWRPWYAGAFVGREGSPARLGCFVGRAVQPGYAADAARFARDLHDVGFTVIDSELLERASRLASLPFQLELQLDLERSGTVGDTLGVDLTMPSGSVAQTAGLFTPGGMGARALGLLESWGMADGRWQELMGATMARAVPLPPQLVARSPSSHSGEEVCLALACRPVFIKAKWRAGEPQPAKLYLHCSIVPVSSRG